MGLHWVSRVAATCLLTPNLRMADPSVTAAFLGFSHVDHSPDPVGSMDGVRHGNEILSSGTDKRLRLTALDPRSIGKSVV